MIDFVVDLLEEFGLDALEHPAWLLLSVVVMAVLVVSARDRPPAIAWPGIREARSAGAHRHDPVRILSMGLRALCLVCLAGVLAGPVAVHRSPPEPGTGGASAQCAQNSLMGSSGGTPQRSGSRAKWHGFSSRKKM